MTDLKIDYKELGKAAGKVEKSDTSGIEALKSDIAQYKSDVKEYKEDLRHVNTIMVAGVVLLLVMVATLMAMLLINYINSFDNYTNAEIQHQSDDYQLLQERMDLQKSSSSSGKINNR